MLQRRVSAFFPTVLRKRPYNYTWRVQRYGRDFIRHYRALTNVVTRPTGQGGQGFNLVGHHEIMLPLIAAGVIEQLA